MEAAEAKVGPEGLAAAQRLAGSVAFGPIAGHKGVFLCHILCELGALDGVPALRDIRDWMDRNPREVLLLVVEDAAPAAVIKDAFERSGLAAYANEFQPLSGRPFPTLRQMIDSGKRLFVMAEDHGESSGWYHRAYDVMMETPFAFRSPGELQTDASCRPNRGGTGKPLSSSTAGWSPTRRTLATRTSSTSERTSSSARAAASGCGATSRTCWPSTSSSAAISSAPPTS